MAIVRQCLTATLTDPGLPRAAEARFYCVTPRGKAIGRAFPAWQFAAPVPELLAPGPAPDEGSPKQRNSCVFGNPGRRVRRPYAGEVLAGRAFESRAALSARQASSSARYSVACDMATRLCAPTSEGFRYGAASRSATTLLKPPARGRAG